MPPFIAYFPCCGRVKRHPSPNSMDETELDDLEITVTREFERNSLQLPYTVASLQRPHHQVRIATGSGSPRTFGFGEGVVNTVPARLPNTYHPSGMPRGGRFERHMQAHAASTASLVTGPDPPVVPNVTQAVVDRQIMLDKLRKPSRQDLAERYARQQHSSTSALTGTTQAEGELTEHGMSSGSLDGTVMSGLREGGGSVPSTRPGTAVER